MPAQIKPQQPLAKKIAGVLKQHGTNLDVLSRELAYLVASSWKDQKEEGGINWDQLLRRTKLFKLQKRIARCRVKPDFDECYIRYLVKDESTHKDFKLLVSAIRVILQQNEREAVNVQREPGRHGINRWTAISALAAERVFSTSGSEGALDTKKRKLNDDHQLDRGKLLKVSVRGSGISQNSHRALITYRSLFPQSSISVHAQDQDDDEDNEQQDEENSCSDETKNGEETFEIDIPKYALQDLVFYRSKVVPSDGETLAVPVPPCESSSWRKGVILESKCNDNGNDIYTIQDAETSYKLHDISAIDLYSENEWTLLTDLTGYLIPEITAFVIPDSDNLYIRERGWFEVSILPGQRYSMYHKAFEALKEIQEEANRKKPAIVGQRKSVRQRSRPASKAWPPSPGLDHRQADSNPTEDNFHKALLIPNPVEMGADNSSTGTSTQDKSIPALSEEGEATDATNTDDVAIPDKGLQHLMLDMSRSQDGDDDASFELLKLKLSNSSTSPTRSLSTRRSEGSPNKNPKSVGVELNRTKLAALTEKNSSLASGTKKFAGVQQANKPKNSKKSDSLPATTKTKKEDKRNGGAAGVTGNRRTSWEKANDDASKLLEWDPLKYSSLEHLGDKGDNNVEEYLSTELKELAFLLEQASVMNVGQQVNSWKHVDKHMSPVLRRLVESKHHLASFRQHGKKMRCLVGENLKRRDAFNVYRNKLRTLVFGTQEHKRVNKTQAREGEKKQDPSKHRPSAKLPPPLGTTTSKIKNVVSGTTSSGKKKASTPKARPLPMIQHLPPTQTAIAVAVAVVKEANEANVSPVHSQRGQVESNQNSCETNDERKRAALPTTTFLNGASHSRRESVQSVSSDESGHSVVVVEPNGIMRPGGTQNAERKKNRQAALTDYLNELKEFDIFSSSIRREAYLSIHLARWNSWHLAKAPRNEIFLRAADMTTTRFCEDEITLSNETCSKAKKGLQGMSDVLELVDIHFELRRKIWVWWCSLVKSCYIDFASQFPRVLTDFTFSQRSLWEYYAHVEIAMRDNHTDCCCRKINYSIDPNSFTTVQSRLACMKSIIDGLAIRPNASFIHRYLSNLCQYHDSSCSLRKQSFLRHYVEKWKAWFGNHSARERNIHIFLSVQESMVEQFRVDESSLIQQHFRAPYLGQVDTSNAFGMPWFTRELEFYFTMREKMWFWFSREILVESWKHQSIYSADFEEKQSMLWRYFDSIEEAMLQVHVARCAKDVPN